jgi:hypothetical protein
MKTDHLSCLLASERRRQMLRTDTYTLPHEDRLNVDVSSAKINKHAPSPNNAIKTLTALAEGQPTEKSACEREHKKSFAVGPGDNTPKR